MSSLNHTLLYLLLIIELTIVAGTACGFVGGIFSGYYLMSLVSFAVGGQAAICVVLLLHLQPQPECEPEPEQVTRVDRWA